MGFWWTFFRGHLSLGNFTIFGANAMHWSITFHTNKYGYVHIDLPTFNRLIGKVKWCVYVSPNATPWACTWYIGNKEPKEKIRAMIRKVHFGHNPVMVSGEYKEGSPLYRLNELMDVMMWKDGLSYLKVA